MDSIYHEMQEGSLCGQHCLNNLLQGKFFTAVDLADIAQQMDSAEQQQMAELGRDTEAFLNFLEQPSGNVDDSGMFSVQVLSTALKVWDLSLVPFEASAPLALAARNNTVGQKAYICNFREHWFTVRKLGFQWFNLNSLLTFPELISDTYLSLFLLQLQHEGYSIFVVDGLLPSCEAEDILQTSPAVQNVRPKLLSEVKTRSGQGKDDHDEELKAALAASLLKVGASSPSPQIHSSEEDLQAAIRMSLAESLQQPSTSLVTKDEEELQRAIKLSLGKEASSSCKAGTSLSSKNDDDLEKALQMSLDSSLCRVEVPENPLAPETEDLKK